MCENRLAQEYWGITDSTKLPVLNFEVVNASIDARKLTHRLIVLKPLRAGRLLLGWFPEGFIGSLRGNSEGTLSQPLIILDNEVARLHKMFRPEIEKLEQDIGKDFDVWIRQK